jgi:hypothetical protein
MDRRQYDEEDTNYFKMPLHYLELRTTIEDRHKGSELSLPARSKTCLLKGIFPNRTGEEMCKAN